jgi:hypothetical protein
VILAKLVKVLQDNKELKVLKAIQVIVVQLAQQDPQAYKVNVDYRVSQALLVL